MNENEVKEPQTVIVKMGDSEIELNATQVEVLATLAQDDWATVKNMVAFADTVIMSLSIGGEYRPSDEGRHRVLQMAADMKFFLYQLINDKTYEQFQ